MAQIVYTDELMFKGWEPKQKNRFVLKIDGIPSFMIKSTNRPSPSSEDIVLDNINVQHKVKGKTTWGDVSLTLYDPISPSGAQAAMEWFRLTHESVTGRDGYADMYKKDCTIQVIGPIGDVVEEWTLKGAWPKEVNFGDLDQGSAEPTTIDITLSIDYAILQY